MSTATGFGPHALRDLDPEAAADAIESLSEDAAARALSGLNPAQAAEVMEHLDPAYREKFAASSAGDRLSGSWISSLRFEEGSVGRLMQPPVASFLGDTPVDEVVQALRGLIEAHVMTYVYCVDAAGVLKGVSTFRDLLFAIPGSTLGQVAMPDPFRLSPDTSQLEAMREVVVRHYPEYPVCDEGGTLVGVVRGQHLFEQQAFEISAQAGSMVGVEKEERIATPWQRSLRFRHPWLQLNLLTAFVAAAVVGFFQESVNEIVLLAVFLPVLAGQCGNTGCQALAVTLRGMTLGDYRAGRESDVVRKEALLGLVNGAITGVVAAAGMYFMAASQGREDALLLALITWLAMLASCMLSGVAGAGIPILLQRAGTDPATASSIFLTTATDVVSMGVFLGLATWWLL